MKALSVRQPYAHALVEGWKGVENRTQTWSHRGWVAIHAPREPHRVGLEDPLVQEAWADTYGETLTDSIGSLVFGAVVGVVNLTSIHRADGDCCAPWGQHAPRVRHLVVANPVALPVPIACNGSLGMWTLTPEVERQVLEQVTLTRG